MSKKASNLNLPEHLTTQEITGACAAWVVALGVLPEGPKCAVYRCEVGNEKVFLGWVGRIYWVNAVVVNGFECVGTSPSVAITQCAIFVLTVWRVKPFPVGSQ